MVRLIWSPRAAKDLEDICDYIALDSEHYARAFAQRIVTLVEEIPRFPYAGRVVPEYNDRTLREKIFHNYRVVYRIKKKCIEIVTICHGARNMPNDLG